jgi:hypothetical protein
MNKPIDIYAAEREFKDANDRLDALQAHLYNIDNEVALLLHLKKSLQENISILKSRQIITVALEYRKAKEDLDKIYNKLTMLRINKNNLGHSVEQARKFLAERREQYLLAMEEQTPKVIEVDFGRKDDRQDGDPA